MPARTPADPRREALATRARAGDAAALSELVALLRPDVETFVARKIVGALKRRETPEDVAQSVCAEAIADLPHFQFESMEAFRAWLFRIAERKLVDKARHHGAAKRDAQRERPLPDQSQDLSPAELSAFASVDSPSRHAQARELAERAARAYDKLSPSHRQVIWLARVEHLDSAEIAARLGIPEAQARMRLSRALARLATLLAGKRD